MAPLAWDWPMDFFPAILDSFQSGDTLQNVFHAVQDPFLMRPRARPAASAQKARSPNYQHPHRAQLVQPAILVHMQLFRATAQPTRRANLAPQDHSATPQRLHNVTNASPENTPPQMARLLAQNVYLGPFSTQQQAHACHVSRGRSPTAADPCRVQRAKKALWPP